MIRTTRLVLAGVMLIAGAAHGQPSAQPQAPTQSQTQTPAPAKPPVDQADRLLAAPINDGEAYHRADDAEQDPAEVRTTQALNAEIASRNDLADNQDRADQAAFEAERARHEAVVAQANQDRLAHEAAVRHADAARRAWEADRARWEADVRACEGGDRSRCAAPN